MTKRILALLLSLVVLAGCIAGCDIADSLADISDSRQEEVTENADKGNGDSFGDAYDSRQETESKTETETVTENDDKDNGDKAASGFASVDGIPDYSGKAYVALNNNIPEFTYNEKNTKNSYEYYSELDSLGRCGYTVACVGKDIMPTDDRESISSVKPSGWKNKKYSTALVDGGYIYNRCHLIGFQLTGENANKNNLITGTRYLNIEGMLPFENMVADYVKETGNHVMYRVTPVFVGHNLLASGVKIEGWSVEDGGEGICFNVFAYNVQPGIAIDYATGENVLASEAPSMTETEADTEAAVGKTYVLNTGTKKIHNPDCSSVKKMSEANKKEYTGGVTALEAQGYSMCGICKPQ